MGETDDRHAERERIGALHKYEIGAMNEVLLACERESAALASKLETAREALQEIAEIQYNRLDTEEGSVGEHVDVAHAALAALASPEAPQEQK